MAAGLASVLGPLSMGYMSMGDTPLSMGNTPQRTWLPRTRSVTAVQRSATFNVRVDDPVLRRAVIDSMGSCYLVDSEHSPDPSKQWFLCSAPSKSEEVSRPLTRMSLEDPAGLCCFSWRRLS